MLPDLLYQQQKSLVVMHIGLLRARQIQTLELRPLSYVLPELGVHKAETLVDIVIIIERQAIFIGVKPMFPLVFLILLFSLS